MALTCNAEVLQFEDFEFIDCGTISISYSQRGIATVSFTIVSTKETLLNNYTNLTFGGVNFQLYMRDVTVSLIPGTLVFTYQVSMTGFGC
jgi:hypothetical protein